MNLTVKDGQMLAGAGGRGPLGRAEGTGQHQGSEVRLEGGYLGRSRGRQGWKGSSGSEPRRPEGKESGPPRPGGGGSREAAEEGRGSREVLPLQVWNGKRTRKVDRGPSGSLSQQCSCEELGLSSSRGQRQKGMRTAGREEAAGLGRRKEKLTPTCKFCLRKR